MFGHHSGMLRLAAAAPPHLESLATTPRSSPPRPGSGHPRAQRCCAGTPGRACRSRPRGRSRCSRHHAAGQRCARGSLCISIPTEADTSSPHAVPGGRLQPTHPHPPTHLERGPLVWVLEEAGGGQLRDQLLVEALQLRLAAWVTGPLGRSPAAAGGWDGFAATDAGEGTLQRVMTAGTSAHSLRR